VVVVLLLVVVVVVVVLPLLLARRKRPRDWVAGGWHTNHTALCAAATVRASAASPPSPAAGPLSHSHPPPSALPSTLYTYMELRGASIRPCTPIVRAPTSPVGYLQKTRLQMPDATTELVGPFPCSYSLPSISNISSSTRSSQMSAVVTPFHAIYRMGPSPEQAPTLPSRRFVRSKEPSTCRTAARRNFDERRSCAS
jgi:hypothetical protein